MEQSQYTNVAQPQPYEQDQQETKLKAPIFVKIASWFILLWSILYFFQIIPVIILSTFASFVFSGKGFSPIIPLFIGIGLVVISFGIRHMRRWALYTFTVITVLSTGFSFYFHLLFFLSRKVDLNLRIIVVIGLLVINVLILIYLWSIFKKFK